MGLTERQILWRVELPLATPEIVAGLRIATVSTVALATFAVFVDGGGLGVKIYGGGNLTFPTSIIIAGGIAMLMALAFDLVLVAIAALHDPVAKGGDQMTGALVPPFLPASIGGAIEFIFEPQSSNVTGGKKVGGLEQVIELTLNQLEVTLFALALAIVDRAADRPLPRPPGHRRDCFAVGLGNVGRAVPELALIALMAAVIGVGLLNLTIALAVLGIPPILTNAFVGIRQVDRAPVDAARGMGMTETEILLKVEMPLAVPTLMAGIRGATIAIVATATIAPIAGVLTLGDFIINHNVYGDNGLLAGGILVALLALALEFVACWTAASAHFERLTAAVRPDLFPKTTAMQSTREEAQ